MQVGGYSLDLYCDNDKCPRRDPRDDRYRSSPSNYTDEYGSRCRAAARKAGWKLARTSGGKDLCPYCSGKR